MKICEDHFDAVEQAIIARGLGDLIPSPGDNHRLLRAWSKGILTLETFDPVSLALGCIRRVMTETAAAHPESAEGISMSECPLCWVDETNPPLDAPDFDSASPEGLKGLTVADLKKVGCNVEETGDVIVIRFTDTAVDKLVKALLKDALDEATQQAA